MTEKPELELEFTVEQLTSPEWMKGFQEGAHTVIEQMRHNHKIFMAQRNAEGTTKESKATMDMFDKLIHTHINGMAGVVNKVVAGASQVEAALKGRKN